jgi:hypothetical protein
MPRVTNSSTAPSLAIIAMILASAGCGAEGLPIVPVSGKVTYAGGPCPTEGTISFTPVNVEEGLPRRPGRASFKEDGVFEATSFREGDGLVPGTYTALISCWMGQPISEDPTSFERLNYVPKTYRPEVVVKRDAGSVEVNFDIPKKPTAARR